MNLPTLTVRGRASSFAAHSPLLFLLIPILSLLIRKFARFPIVSHQILELLYLFLLRFFFRWNISICLLDFRMNSRYLKHRLRDWLLILSRHTTHLNMSTGGKTTECKDDSAEQKERASSGPSVHTSLPYDVLRRNQDVLKAPASRLTGSRPALHAGEVRSVSSIFTPLPADASTTTMRETTCTPATETGVLDSSRTPWMDQPHYHQFAVSPRPASQYPLVSGHEATRIEGSNPVVDRFFTALEQMQPQFAEEPYDTRLRERPRPGLAPAAQQHQPPPLFEPHEGAEREKRGGNELVLNRFNADFGQVEFGVRDRAPISGMSNREYRKIVHLQHPDETAASSELLHEPTIQPPATEYKIDDQPQQQSGEGAVHPGLILESSAHLVAIHGEESISAAPSGDGNSTAERLSSSKPTRELRSLSPAMSTEGAQDYNAERAFRSNLLEVEERQRRRPSVTASRSRNSSAHADRNCSPWREREARVRVQYNSPGRDFLSGSRPIGSPDADAMALDEDDDSVLPLPIGAPIRQEPPELLEYPFPRMPSVDTDTDGGVVGLQAPGEFNKTEGDKQS